MEIEARYRRCENSKYYPRYTYEIHPADSPTKRQLDEEERRPLLEESIQLANQLQRKDNIWTAAPLQPTSATTSVEGSRTETGTWTDGPFAEDAGADWRLFLVDRPRISMKPSTILARNFPERDRKL